MLNQYYSKIEKKKKLGQTLIEKFIRLYVIFVHI